MPRFFFHVFDGRAVLDTDGINLADAEAAQLEAVRLAGAILRDEAGRIVVGEDWRMEVTDGRGLILFRLDFSVRASAAVGGHLRRPLVLHRGPGPTDVPDRGSKGAE